MLSVLLSVSWTLCKVLGAKDRHNSFPYVANGPVVYGNRHQIICIHKHKITRKSIMKERLRVWDPIMLFVCKEDGEIFHWELMKSVVIWCKDRGSSDNRNRGVVWRVMLAEKLHAQGTCGRREPKEDLLDDKSKSMVQNKAGEERMVRTMVTGSHLNKHGAYCKSKEKPLNYHEQWIDGICISKKIGRD